MPIDPTKPPAKILLLGKQGHGKTGAKAALVAAGYKLRSIDTDKGANILRSLLTDPRRPYAAIMAKNGIKYEDAVSVVPISVPMKLRPVTVKIGDKTTSETILAPVNGNAWNKILDTLNKWLDGTNDYGSAFDWGSDAVLDFDTLSTMAKMVYYHSQALNGRLGAREQGFSHMQDIKSAHSQLSRFFELIANDTLRCNVIVNTHVIWIDEEKSRNKFYSPEGMPTDEKGQMMSNYEGFPEAIGEKLSLTLGKHFNDVYCVKQSGSGTSVKRIITTLPSEGITTKSSAYLDREYSQATGLAEIFAILRGEPLPPDFVSSITKPGPMVAPGPSKA